MRWDDAVEIHEYAVQFFKPATFIVLTGTSQDFAQEIEQNNAKIWAHKNTFILFILISLDELDFFFFTQVHFKRLRQMS